MSVLDYVPAGCARHTALRYETGELGGEEKTVFESHLAGCAHCQATLDDLAADKRAFQAAMPFAAFEAGLARRTERARPFWSRRLVLWPLLAAGAAAAALVLMPASGTSPGAWDGIKGGGPSLRYYVKTVVGARPGVDGEALRAGDALRLQAGAGGRKYLLVIGVDADGKIYPWLSADGRSVPAGTEATMLPGSVVLDDDPRPERIFALASDAPLALADVARAAEAAVRAAGGVAGLRQIPGVDAEQASVLIQKAK